MTLRDGKGERMITHSYMALLSGLCLDSISLLQDKSEQRLENEANIQHTTLYTMGISTQYID